MNGYHTDPIRSQIREVWADNLEEEFKAIRDVVEHYQYIAMDTEFPGIVARPTGTCVDYNYQTLKCNVDLLKVIQLGITFADSHGNLANNISTWQFNFSFNLERDMYAQDSIDFLKVSGIDFEKQQKKGIALQDFGELIMSSGLVMNEDVKWISFHGSYDFGYLLKLLTCAPLPHSEVQFFELLHDFFPALYDIKFLLMNSRKVNFNAGQSLQKIADHLGVKRIGRQHQAGSDSLITCRTFFKLMETSFDNQIDDSKFSGVIYGLGAASIPKSNRPSLQEPINGTSSYTSQTISQVSASQMIKQSHTHIEEKVYYLSPNEINSYKNSATQPTEQQQQQQQQPQQQVLQQAVLQHTASALQQQANLQQNAVNLQQTNAVNLQQTNVVNLQQTNAVNLQQNAVNLQQPPPPPPPPSTQNGSSIGMSGGGVTTPPSTLSFDVTPSNGMIVMGQSNTSTHSNTNISVGGVTGNNGLLEATATASISNGSMMGTYPLNQLLNQMSGNTAVTREGGLNIHNTQSYNTQNNYSIYPNTGRLTSPHTLIYPNNDHSEQANLHRSQDRMLVYEGPSNGS